MNAPYFISRCVSSGAVVAAVRASLASLLPSQFVILQLLSCMSVGWSMDPYVARHQRRHYALIMACAITFHTTPLW
ncbi:hypothetical protein J3F83DRAFT_725095 [Trichoderma novae-zelandiae]